MNYIYVFINQKTYRPLFFRLKKRSVFSKYSIWAKAQIISVSLGRALMPCLMSKHIFPYLCPMQNLKTVLYNLPDNKILKSKKEFDFMVWQPDQKYLVLGRSNEAEKSLIAEAVDLDKVQVLKRPSGGEAVLLSPNMLIIAVKLPLKIVSKPHDAFVIVNNIIKKVLIKQGIKNIQSRGISDISIGEQKVLGSAIFKKPDAVFYHAVLNISEDVNLIGHYLQHPKREPDYRKGRNHLAFVSSLHKEGYPIDIQALKSHISTELHSTLHLQH